MVVKLLTEHHLEFLSLKGGCTGSSESTLVKFLEVSCRGSLIVFLLSNVCLFLCLNVYYSWCHRLVCDLCLWNSLVILIRFSISFLIAKSFLLTVVATFVKGAIEKSNYLFH